MFSCAFPQLQPYFPSSVTLLVRGYKDCLKTVKDATRVTQCASQTVGCQAVCYQLHSHAGVKSRESVVSKLLVSSGSVCKLTKDLPYTRAKGETSHGKLGVDRFTLFTMSFTSLSMSLLI